LRKIYTKTIFNEARQFCFMGCVATVVVLVLVLPKQNSDLQSVGMDFSLQSH
jgi:hypothetical protein